MFDLTAPIVPGESAAGIRIGQRIEEVIRDTPPVSVHPRAGSTMYCFENVNLWVRDKRVTQIGVASGYQGSLAGVIGIGATIREVQTRLGEVFEDEEDNLVISGIDRLCFETDLWKGDHSLQANLDARIVEIFVY